MVRHVASSGTDLFTTIAAATGALSGSKHGGASAAVIQMLQGIGTRENIPRFLVEVRQKKRLLYGFGHSIYRDNDPRAIIVKQAVKEVFRIVGKEPLVQLAVELERIAQADQYL
jgi:citrate synthase